MATSTLRRAVKASIAAVAVAGGLIAGVATAYAELPPDELQAVTDQYVFGTGLESFQSIRAEAPNSDQLDWGSDGCSNSPDNPFGFDFVKACYRHDFGYRNYKLQGRFSEPNRLNIDNQFKSDLYQICAGNWACEEIADIYYAAVRQFGDNSVDTADVLDKASVQAQAKEAAAAG